MKKIFGDPALPALGLFLLFLPYFLIVSRLHPSAYNNLSDSFLFIDIARNLAQGRGLAVSFNFYRFWPGVFYPSFVFVPIGWPLLLAPVYNFFESSRALFFINPLLGFFNCLLVYAVARRVLSNRSSAVWSAFLLAVSAVTANTVLKVQTEQLSLFLLLAGVWFFVSFINISRSRLFLIASLLALNFFVRSASVFYPICFFLALAFSRRENGGRATDWILILPIFFWLAYELFIFYGFGTFFPAYPAAFKNYYLATFVSGGSFFSNVPVTRPVPVDIGIFSCGWKNLTVCGQVLAGVLRVIVVFALLRLPKIFRRREPAELLLALLAISGIIGVWLWYGYMPLEVFHATRFLLVPVICLLLLGIKEMEELLVKGRFPAGWFLFHAILFFSFAANVLQTYRIIEPYVQGSQKEEKVRELNILLDWVAKSTVQGDLVAASEYVLAGADLNRPVVNIPAARLLTRENFEDFITLYRPKAFVFEKSISIQRWLIELGYRRSATGSKEPLFEAYIFEEKSP